MADRRIKFRCAYTDCGQTTQLVVDIPVGSRPSDKKEKLVYCEHCNRPNLISVPQTWDRSSPVLSDGVVGHNDSIPVVQGRKP